MENIGKGDVLPHPLWVWLVATIQINYPINELILHKYCIDTALMLLYNCIEVNYMKRVVVNLEETLVEQLESYAKKLHINRTSAVAVLLSQGLTQDKTLDTLSKIVEMSEQKKL